LLVNGTSQLGKLVCITSLDLLDRLALFDQLFLKRGKLGLELRQQLRSLRLNLVQAGCVLYTSAFLPCLNASCSMPPYFILL
jgi:hypothetical protein